MKKLRTTGAGLLSAGIVATALGVYAPTASAAIDELYVLTGNFTGDARAEVFIYRPGPAQDELLSFELDGNSMVATSTLFNVNGFYDPVAGDFDRDGKDEIFWYAPGAAGDWIWNFQSFTSATGVPYTVNGSYDPRSGDFNGDGYHDVLWYGPGAAADGIWYFRAGGYTPLATSVSGVYKPVVGSFGKDATDDVLWYAPGSAPDPMWDFTRGTSSFTARVLSASGVYQPFSADLFGEGWRSEDVFWYTPNASPDPIWDFYLGQRFTSTSPIPVGGGFVPGSGDLLNDGYDDTIWQRLNGSFEVADNYCDDQGCFTDVYSFDAANSTASIQVGTAGATIALDSVTESKV